MAEAFTIGLFAVAFLLAARMGRWHLLQTVVFSAVMCAGIYWKWTIGGTATSIVAGLAAFIVTIAVAILVGLVRLVLKRAADTVRNSPTVH